MNIIDVLLHIRTNLDDEDRNNVELELGEMDGVISPHFTDKNHHLLMVAYNSDKVNSGGLMKKVTSMGLDANIIGL